MAVIVVVVCALLHLHYCYYSTQHQDRNGRITKKKKIAGITAEQDCSILCPDPIPGIATKTELPAGVLYRVQATYRYDKEDPDELSFEIGETINVIEYDDPEDQVGKEVDTHGINNGTHETSLLLFLTFRCRRRAG